MNFVAFLFSFLLLEIFSFNFFVGHKDGYVAVIYGDARSLQVYVGFIILAQKLIRELKHVTSRESFYGGQFTLVTLWLIIYFSVPLSHRRSTQFIFKLNLLCFDLSAILLVFLFIHCWYFRLPQNRHNLFILGWLCSSTYLQSYRRKR